MIEVTAKDGSLMTLGGRRRRFDPDSEFFLEGNHERFSYYKVFSSEFGAMDTTMTAESSAEEDSSKLYREQFRCKEINCNQCFYSLHEVGIHGAEVFFLSIKFNTYTKP